MPQTDFNPAMVFPEMVEMDGHRTDQTLGRSAKDNYQLYHPDQVIISNILFASTPPNMSYWMTLFQQSLIY